MKKALLNNIHSIKIIYFTYTDVVYICVGVLDNLYISQTLDVSQCSLFCMYWKLGAIEISLIWSIIKNQQVMSLNLYYHYIQIYSMCLQNES